MHQARFSLTRGLSPRYWPLLAMHACLALIMLASTNLVAGEPAPDAVPVAGWLERARLSPGDIVLEAKPDTGTRTSSLHAINLRQFERDGKNWVTFDVMGNGGRSVHLERPLVRMVSVSSASGVDQARPAVKLGICIGNVYRVTEVNLVDRSSLAKLLLIGRRFLNGRLHVDASRCGVVIRAAAVTAPTNRRALALSYRSSRLIENSGPTLSNERAPVAG